VLQQNPDIYFNGCPCHIIYILYITQHRRQGNLSQKFLGLTLKNLSLICFIGLTNLLNGRMDFSHIVYFVTRNIVKVMKYVSTRWLTLEIAVERSLKQFPSISEDESQARFRSLQTNFTDLMTEVYLMFFQLVLPYFIHHNQFLQREELSIHVLQPQLEKLLKNILAKFIKPAVIAEGLKNDDGLLSVDFKDKTNHVTNSNLVIRYVTKQTAQKLLKEGDISLYQQTTFFNAAKAFFIKATEYLLKWCPLKDELLLLMA